MRTVLAMAVAVALAVGTFSAASAADEKKANPQQERMKKCNSQAGDKKGDERKAFGRARQSPEGDEPPS